MYTTTNYLKYASTNFNTSNYTQTVDANLKVKFTKDLLCLSYFIHYNLAFLKRFENL